MTCLVGAMGGTTSACAENTGFSPRRDTRMGNYLRVRGEYQQTFGPHKYYPELPPRARRIQIVTPNSMEFIGTTSACAENTA